MTYGAGLYGAGIYGGVTVTTPGVVTPTLPDVVVPTPDPLRVYVRDGQGVIRGELTSFDELTVVDRWRDVGRWTMVTSDPDTVALLAAHDAGVVVRRGETVIMSGPTDYRQRAFQGGVSVLTLGGPDDSTHLAGTLAWGDPGGTLAEQATARDKQTGPAESLILGYINRNLVSRLGSSVVVPASQGRGRVRTFGARFHTLLEVCQRVASLDADLGFRLAQQEDRTVAVEVWQASDLTSQGGLLSDLTGTTLDWTYSEQWPTVTRVLVAGGDQGADRLIRRRISSGRESTWDRIVESWLDRRDIDPTDETAAVEMDEAGDEALADGLPSQSFRIQISDVGGLLYGRDFRIGDLVRAYPAGVQVDDRITEATISVTREGELVSMWIGQKDDDPDERVERRARALDRRLRQLERAY